MGARSGGLGVGFNNQGGNTRITGVDRYGQMQTYSLQGEIKAYKEIYKKLDKELGAEMKKQAKGMTSEQLKKYLPSGTIGVEKIKKQWKESLKKYKGGGYDISVVSKSSDDFGKLWMKDIARIELQNKVIKGELKKRK